MHSPEVLKHQMQSISGLYADLFVLMLQNVAEQQEREAANLMPDVEEDVDASINQLMHEIDNQTKYFRTSVGEARGTKLATQEVEAELSAFDDRLREGLSAMQLRIETRQKQISGELDLMRQKLKLVQRKQTGARGYKSGKRPERMISSSV